MPNAGATSSSIVRPSVNANNFELKPALINIIQQDQFSGFPSEDPNEHLAIFLEKCDTIKINGASDEAIRLRISGYFFDDDDEGCWTSVFTEELLLPLYLGAATDVGSLGAAADVGSSGVVVAEEKLSEKKQKRIKLVATKGKGKKVEKGVKEKQNVKFEDPDGEDVDEVQGSKSVFYGMLRNRMSPSSVVNVLKKLSEDQLIAIRAIGFGSLEFLKVSQLPLQLGFWLVKHFDAQSCSLNILDSKPFKIIEQHVHEVLGLPVGGMEMDANVFSKDDKLLYVDQFVIEEVRAKRETPVLKGWTTKMLSSREKLEIFKERLGRFDKNLKVVGPSSSKQPKMVFHFQPILSFSMPLALLVELNWNKSCL
uniref:Uncharacterized protein n=1 Tax=Chenopodium quinoa TaxID=63459 RepID=A0A803LJQ5_CHEQI